MKPWEKYQQGQAEAIAEPIMAPTVMMPAGGPEDLRAETPAPYAPIPEVVSPQMRATPASRTPLEAAKASTAAELMSLGTGARALWNLAQMDAPERATMQTRLGKLQAEQEERAGDFPVSTFAGQVAPYMALPQSTVSTPLRGGLMGGAIGGLTSGGDPTMTGLGAAGGAGGALLGRHMARPFTPSPQAQRLMAMDIQPSVGQGVRQGPVGSTVRSMEEKLVDLPIVGNAIQRARRRPEQEVIQEAMRRATPRGYAVPGADDVRGAMQRFDDVFDDAYGSVYAGTVFQQSDADRAALSKAVSDRAIRADEETRQKALMRVNDLIDMDIGLGDEISGEHYKFVESAIKKDWRDLAKSADPEQRELGSLYRNILRELQRWRNTQLPKDLQRQAKDVDRAYANYLRIERAASGLGAEEGQLTPSQLQNAVRAMSGGVRKKEFAGGRSLMQDLSEPAKTVLTSKTPQSGTTPRALANVATLGATGALGSVSPAAAMGGAGLMGGAWLTQPRWMQRYLLGNTPLGRMQGPMGKMGAIPGIQAGTEYGPGYLPKR